MSEIQNHLELGVAYESEAEPLWSVASATLNLATIDMQGGFAELFVQFRLPKDVAKETLLLNARQAMASFQEVVDEKITSLPEYVAWRNLTDQLAKQSDDIGKRRDEIATLEKDYGQILASGDAGMIDRTRRRLHESKLYLAIVDDDITKLQKLTFDAAVKLRLRAQSLSGGGERIRLLEQNAAEKEECLQALGAIAGPLLCQLSQHFAIEAELSSGAAADYARTKLTRLGIPENLPLPSDVQAKNHVNVGMVQVFGDKRH